MTDTSVPPLPQEAGWKKTVTMSLVSVVTILERRPNGHTGKASRKDLATLKPERQEPRHATLVLPVRLAELAHEATLLEKRPDIEINDDGRGRGRILQPPPRARLFADAARLAADRGGTH